MKVRFKKMIMPLMFLSTLVGSTIITANRSVPEKVQAVNYAAEADFTKKTNSNSSYNSSWTYATNWTIYGGANNNGGWEFIKFGGKKDTLANANPVYLRGLVSKKVSQIDVVFNAGNLTVGSVSSWGVKVYSDSSYSTLVTSSLGGTMTKKTAATLSLTPSSGDYWAVNSYYEVYFDLVNTTTTNGIVWVDKIQFVEYPEASIDLSSLSFTGSPTKTVYFEGENFDPTGLTITATYTDSSTANVTSQTIWQKLTLSMTSVIGTYTYTGLNTVSKTVNISGITVNVAPVIGNIIDGHKYLITAAQPTTGVNQYILKAQVGESNSFADKYSKDYTSLLLGIENYTLADAYTFIKCGINEYYIKSGENYLSAISDNNGLVLSSTVDSWKVTEAVGTTTSGVSYNGVFLQDKNQSRYLTNYATAPDFRTYTSTTGQALPAACIVLYDMTILEGYASSFNSAIEAVCNLDGNTNIGSLSTAWMAQKSSFNSLTNGQKLIFTNAVGSPNGTAIKKAISKYEYVASKYNTQLSASDWDYMNRGVETLNELGKPMLGDTKGDIILLSILGGVGTLQIGLYFFLRKRKISA